MNTLENLEIQSRVRMDFCN